MYTVLMFAVPDSYIGVYIWHYETCYCILPPMSHGVKFEILFQIVPYQYYLFIGQTKLSPVKMSNLPDICLMSGCYLQAWHNNVHVIQEGL